MYNLQLFTKFGGFTDIVVFYAEAARARASITAGSSTTDSAWALVKASPSSKARSFVAGDCSCGCKFLMAMAK